MSLQEKIERVKQVFPDESIEKLEQLTEEEIDKLIEQIDRGTAMNKITPERGKMLFYVLMQAAMRYRECYWEEDVIDAEAKVVKGPDAGVMAFLVQKYGEKKAGIAKLNLIRQGQKEAEKYKHEQMRINKFVYKLIDDALAGLPPAANDAYDNIATAFGLACEELILSSNRTHSLTLLRLYNQGMINPEIFGDDKKFVEPQENKQE